MRRRVRQFLLVAAVMFCIAVGLGWAQSYRGKDWSEDPDTRVWWKGGETVCAYKNHQSFNLTSFEGRVHFAWYWGMGLMEDPPNPRRWHWLHWQPQEHVPTGSFVSSSPENDAQTADYWFTPGPEGYSYLVGLGGTVHEFAGVAVGWAYPPPYKAFVLHPYFVVAVPYWLLAACSALFLALATWRAVRGARREERLRRRGCCLKCGYDLRASDGRCPECGTAIPAGWGGRGVVAVVPRRSWWRAAVARGRRVDLRLRRATPWILVNAALATIILLEVHPPWRTTTLRATVIPEAAAPAPLHDIANEKMQGMRVQEAVERIARRAGVSIEVNWTVWGAGMGPESRIKGVMGPFGTGFTAPENLLYEIFNELHAPGNPSVAQVVRKPDGSGLYISTREEILARLGQTVAYRVPELIEPSRDLCSNWTREKRCDKLVELLRGDGEIPLDGSVEGGTLKVRTFPGRQAYVAALLKALQGKGD